MRRVLGGPVEVGEVSTGRGENPDRVEFDSDWRTRRRK